MSNATDEGNDIRTEYDFSEGVRGKYTQRHASGTNVVVLDPDVAKTFRTSEEVNNALRKLAETAEGSLTP